MSLLNTSPIGYTPVPFARLFVYLDGTSTLTSIYSDAALATERTNPAIADETGLFPQVHLDDTKTYRIVITGSDGDTLSPVYEASGAGGAARPSSPIDEETGASYAATLGDAGRVKKRSHTDVMTDTLPAPATAGNGYKVTFWNAAIVSTRTLAISVSGAGTIDGSSTRVLQIGQQTEFTCDGTEYHAVEVARTVGYEEIPFAAGSMVPATTNGAAYSKIEYGGYNFNFDAYLFDDTTEESVWFPMIALPGWDGGPIGVRVLWQRDTGGSGDIGQGITWAAAGRGVINYSGLDAAMGAEATVSDAVELRNSIHETSTFYVTLAGGYTGRVFLQLKLMRKPADASDTLVGDARLVHASIFYRKTTSVDTP